MGNPRRLYVADKSKPEIRQRQPQTNTRKCGTQPAHKSMPAVVKMPCLLLCSTASRMRAFVLKAGKERVMIKELANEHKKPRRFSIRHLARWEQPAETRSLHRAQRWSRLRR